jgi:DNA-binding CsgD family transcriptional regulator
MTGPRPAGRRWTPDDENLLQDMVAAGKTAVEIARRLKRTPQAIYARLRRLYRKFHPRNRGGSQSWG